MPAVYVDIKIKPTSKVFILEDDKQRQDWFRRHIPEENITLCVDVFSAKHMLNIHGVQYFDLIFLDHDLGGKQMVESDETTGYEIAKFISKLGHDGQNVIIHSWNGPGSRNMHGLLPKAIRVQFGRFNIEIQKETI
jgi:hypothetical protein